MLLFRPEWIGFGLSAMGCVLCAGFTRAILPAYCRMLQKAQSVRPNYAGTLIPVGVGAVMLFAFWTVGTLVIIADRFLPLNTRLPEILFLASGMAFLGLLDDLAGSRETGGLKGHLQKWVREGELTTGLIKAAGGILLSFGVVIFTIPRGQLLWDGMFLLSIPVDALVIALMANWINLLDVRPGRALKGTLLKIVVLLPFVTPDLSVPLLMIAGAVLAYFPADIRARAMMGDVGANFIGAVLGYLTTQAFDLGVTVIVLAVLILLHFYTESRSLSMLIESNRFLLWVDEWGREKAR